MKKVVLLIILLFSISLNAKRAHVRLLKNASHTGVAHRMPALLPDVSHDDATLFIENKSYIDIMIIKVRDVGTGNILYEQSVSLMPFGRL